MLSTKEDNLMGGAWIDSLGGSQNMTFDSKPNLNIDGKVKFDLVLKNSLLFKTNSQFKAVKDHCLSSKSRVLNFGSNLPSSGHQSFKKKFQVSSKCVSEDTRKMNSINKIVEYSHEEISFSISSHSHISKTKFYEKCIPERILDAPNLKDDFATNILDWGSNNLLAVALEKIVYLWNGNTNDTQALSNCPAEVTSVRWLADCTCLAIGMSNGIVQVWDALKGVQIRNLKGHKSNARITAIESSNLSLFTGGGDKYIFNHDMRKKDHIVQVLKHDHSDEVTSIKLNPHESSFLASSSKDGSVCIWDINQTTHHSENNPYNIGIRNELANESINYNVDIVYPKHFMNHHKNGLRALSFCPWQKNLLVTGGVDKSLKLINVNNGGLINSKNLGAQIYSINWNIFDKEIVTTHGLPKNHISIWKFPDLIEVGNITEHLRRPLFSCLSPDFTTIVTGSAEERLFFWKLFTPNQQSILSIAGKSLDLDELR